MEDKSFSLKLGACKICNNQQEAMLLQYVTNCTKFRFPNNKKLIDNLSN